MFRKAKVASLRFEIGGREVTHGNWHKFGPEVTEDKLDAIAHEVYATFWDTRCPEHRKAPKILCRGPSLDESQFEVTACCDEFKKQVEEKLDALRPTTGCTVRR